VSKNKSRGVIKKVLKEGVIRFFKTTPNKSFNYKQIAAGLNVKDSDTRKMILEILFELKDDESIKEVDRGRYKFNGYVKTLIGVLDGTKSGDAYFVSEESTDDVLIKEKDLRQAFDGDTVSIKLKNRKPGSRPMGEVIEIVQRARTEYAGTIQKNQKYAFFVPDNQNISVDFFIDLTKIKTARNGDKVLAKMLDWPKGKKNPYGEVTVVLGRPGENEAEIHAILAEYNLPYAFPKHVEKAAEIISTDITAAEIKKRRDFRDILTFTIDPHDAKDFDDALSLRRIDDDTWEVGVHIADVSHYVSADSTLDEEAYKRGNSCYLVDRVVPMLPEVLSNGLCSLRPKEEKYTFSSVFELDGNGEIKKEWFGKTVIYSDRRFTYEEAQERIETGEGDLAEECRFLNDMAQKIRSKRIKSGALEIEGEETKFKLDEDGHPVEVYQKVSKEANKLIEEFMLLANKRVAAFMGKPEKGKTVVPFVYRIHDQPSEEKLQDLKLYIKRFGYQLELEKDKPASFAINKLLAAAKKNGDQAFISPMAIKSMAKAVYSPDNIGHYGLAFQYYSHFTSPIRRYADLLVHRLLFNQLNKIPKASEDVLTTQCKHISNTEKQAVQAERASIKFMQVKYMLDKVGEVMPGRITGVTEWGIFVELHNNKCEGLVHIRSMKDDRYVFNHETLQIIGKRNGASFGLGDDVMVEVKDANLAKKQLDFELIHEA
jgi:ribonuclease R